MSGDYLIKINDDVLEILHGNKIIIHNKFNRRSIKISREVYFYIKDAELNKMSKKNFLNCFEKIDDRTYIQKVLMKMEESGILDGEKIYNQEQKMSVYISLTNRCNLKCRHCITKSDITDKDYLNYDDICNILDNVKRISLENIILTGGEPLIREDIYDIIKYIRKNNICRKLILSTNATLINNDNVQFLSENFERIDISIDGYDEESCSKIRGRGVFSHVVDVVNLLHKRDFFKISLSMTFGKKNLDKIENFEKLNKELNTIPIIRHFEPEGRGLENRDIFTDSKSILPMSIPEMADYYFSNYNKEYEFGLFSCNACFEQLFINYDGRVYPCPSLVYDDYCLGLANDVETIEKIADRKVGELCGYNNFESLYPYNYAECKDCDLSLFCLKCPSRVHLIKQNKGLRDEWCNNMKEKMEKMVWGDCR